MSPEPSTGPGTPELLSACQMRERMHHIARHIVSAHHMDSIIIALIVQLCMGRWRSTGESDPDPSLK